MLTAIAALAARVLAGVAPLADRLLSAIAALTRLVGLGWSLLLAVVTLGPLVIITALITLIAATLLAVVVAIWRIGVLTHKFAALRGTNIAVGGGMLMEILSSICTGVVEIAGELGHWKSAERILSLEGIPESWELIVIKSGIVKIGEVLEGGLQWTEGGEWIQGSCDWIRAAIRTGVRSSRRLQIRIEGINLIIQVLQYLSIPVDDCIVIGSRWGWISMLIEVYRTPVSIVIYLKQMKGNESLMIMKYVEICLA